MEDTQIIYRFSWIFIFSHCCNSWEIVHYQFMKPILLTIILSTISFLYGQQHLDIDFKIQTEFCDTVIAYSEYTYHRYTDTSAIDTFNIHTKKFDSDCNIFEEIIDRKGHKLYIRRTFNENGFVTSIDTSGLIGYGRPGFVTYNLDTLEVSHCETKKYINEGETIVYLKVEDMVSNNFYEINYYYNENRRLFKEVYFSFYDNEIIRNITFYSYNTTGLIDKIETFEVNDKGIQKSLINGKIWIYEFKQ